MAGGNKREAPGAPFKGQLGRLVLIAGARLMHLLWAGVVLISASFLTFLLRGIQALRFRVALSSLAPRSLIRWRDPRREWNFNFKGLRRDKTEAGASQVIALKKTTRTHKSNLHKEAAGCFNENCLKLQEPQPQGCVWKTTQKLHFQVASPRGRYNKHV